jgi:two-component system OmpR family sensor kinase
MDGLKRRLSHSLQLRLSLALSVAILLVATLTGIFSYVSAYDEALEFQDNSLRQVAALYLRQGMGFHYAGSQPAVVEDDEKPVSSFSTWLTANSASPAMTTGCRCPYPSRWPMACRPWRWGTSPFVCW